MKYLNPNLLIYLFLIGAPAIMCHKYIVILTDDNIFRPCEKDPDNFIDKYYNMDKLNIMRAENGIDIIVNGSMEVLQEMTGRVKVRLTTLKKTASGYDPTFFNIERSDICSIMWKESEYWYKWTELMTPRVCPGKKGTVFNIDNMNLYTELDLNSLDHVGEYKSIVHSKGICVEIPFEMELLE